VKEHGLVQEQRGHLQASTSRWRCAAQAAPVGRIAQLPAPAYPLPRHKPLPAPRAPTRWEAFAMKKGIQKKKRPTTVWDEDAGEWRRRHGYKRAGDAKEVPIIEASAADKARAWPGPRSFW